MLSPVEYAHIGYYLRQHGVDLWHHGDSFYFRRQGMMSGKD
jgi:hypothetical protein